MLTIWYFYLKDPVNQSMVPFHRYHHPRCQHLIWLPRRQMDSPAEPRQLFTLMEFLKPILAVSVLFIFVVVLVVLIFRCCFSTFLVFRAFVVYILGLAHSIFCCWIFRFWNTFFFLIRWCKLFTLIIRLLVNNTDALHLSIPAQGLPNGDAALQHAAYPGMQPYPGVGKSWPHKHCDIFCFRKKKTRDKNIVFVDQITKSYSIFFFIFFFLFVGIHFFVHSNTSLQDCLFHH